MNTCSLLMAGAVAATLLCAVATGSQPGVAAGPADRPATPPSTPADASAAPPGTGVAPGLFQADTSAKPTVTVSWPRRDGTTATCTVQREYTAPEQRGPLGPNLTTYVALGGTRGEAGAADPRGAIVKVGFYKVEANKPFFEGIADGAAVTVTVTNVRFTRPARPEPQTVVQHGKYEDPNSVLGCTSSQAVSTAMGGLDFYNTVDAADNLAGKITPKNGRLGSLAGLSSSRVEADGSMTWTVTLPYAGLKHPDDPWLRTNPGDFAEPFHFHVEMEVLPADAGPRQQGTSPSKAQTPA